MFEVISCGNIRKDQPRSIGRAPQSVCIDRHRSAFPQVLHALKVVRKLWMMADILN